MVVHAVPSTAPRILQLNGIVPLCVDTVADYLSAVSMSMIQHWKGAMIYPQSLHWICLCPPLKSFYFAPSLSLFLFQTLCFLFSFLHTLVFFEWQLLVLRAASSSFALLKLWWLGQLLCWCCWKDSFNVIMYSHLHSQAGLQQCVLLCLPSRIPVLHTATLASSFWQLCRWFVVLHNTAQLPKSSTSDLSKSLFFHFISIFCWSWAFIEWWRTNALFYVFFYGRSWSSMTIIWYWDSKYFVVCLPACADSVLRIWQVCRPQGLVGGAHPRCSRYSCSSKAQI